MTDSVVGAPQPPLVQLLTPEGERVEHPDYAFDPTLEQLKGFYRDLVLVRRVDTAALQALYRDMVLVRRADREATALQRQGELGLWVPLLGQEAAQVGAGRALRAQDFAFPTYREHGVAWCRGVDPVDLLGLFRGTTAATPR